MRPVVALKTPHHDGTVEETRQELVFENVDIWTSRVCIESKSTAV